MCCSKILCGHRLVHPFLKPELLGQRKPDRGLEAFKDRILRNLALYDQAVEVFPIILSEHLIRRGGLPKRRVIHGLKPVSNILNIFKYNHVTIVSNHWPALQIWRASHAP